MPGNTHATAATRYVQAGDLRFAYRRFGRGAGFPLLMLNYFAANLDDWIMRAFFTSSEASKAAGGAYLGRLDAQLIMYPDASHGAQSQHAEVFLEHARLFLQG
jgi:pimeloyl-ACP methyl ester carboxylesterase